LSDPTQLLWRRSIARCQERWLAAGVSPELAAELAADRRVSVEVPVDSLPLPERPLVILEAEVGSGKSLLSERALQGAIKDFENDSSQPIPCWISAKELSSDLESAVISASSELGDIDVNGLFLVIDGADEPGIGRADEILAQARILVNAFENLRILLTCRPLPPFSDASELVRLPQLPEPRSLEIVEAVSGIDITVGRASRWPQSLREAIGRPLFAVLLGVFLRKGCETPPAPAELLREVVEKALDRAGGADRAALRRIAAQVVEAGGKSVARGQAGDRATEEALAATRLITVSDQHLTFPLILIAQWFAAEAIAIGEVSIESLTDKPENLENWRYPLAIAVGAFSAEQANRVLGVLAEREAGFASQVVEEALTRWSNDGQPLGNGHSAALEVRAAMSSWVTGIGPLAPICAPINDQGRLLPIGYNVEDDWLDTGWYRGQPVQPEIRPLPGSTFDFIGAGIGGEAGFDWTGVRGSRPGAQAAWHWRWAFEDLRDELSRTIKGRNLDFLNGPLRLHHLRIIAKQVLGINRFKDDPIEVRAVIDHLDARDKSLLNVLPEVDIAQHRNRADFEQLLAEGVTSLPSTLESPDPERPGRWVWNLWSKQGHLKRAEQAYSMALGAFEHLIATDFAALAPWMQTASTLPAVVHVEVNASDSAIDQGAPSESMWLEPLPQGADSRVEVRFGSGERWSREQWREKMRELRRLRPLQSRWIGIVYHHGVLDLDQDQDVEELVYRWLWGDLARIKWVDGQLGTPTPGSPI
jgi:hypothetical protein